MSYSEWLERAVASVCGDAICDAAQDNEQMSEWCAENCRDGQSNPTANCIEAAWLCGLFEERSEE